MAVGVIEPNESYPKVHLPPKPTKQISSLSTDMVETVKAKFEPHLAIPGVI